MVFGHREIAAERDIPASATTMFAFLSDLENHWLLASRFIEVLRLEGPEGARHGGEVRMRGPLGVSRRAATRVVEADEPRAMRGVAELGRGTTARVSWALAPRAGGTSVRLAAHVESAGTVDRLLLAAGGRGWLRRRFAGTLDRLAELAPSMSARSENAAPPTHGATAGRR